MAYCIYSGADEKSANFKDSEHIFPKCIGGVNCLPKGWVSDEVNNALSKLEFSFARQNPGIVVSRMFLPQTGRKKHTNRERIGIFKDIDTDSGYMLGFVKDSKPIPLNQLIFPMDVDSLSREKVPVKVIISPDSAIPYKEQFQRFCKKLDKYAGKVVFIEDSNVPKGAYLLGEKDNCWFLGAMQQADAELIAPKLPHVIHALLHPNQAVSLLAAEMGDRRTCHVDAHFTFVVDYFDCLRVYAKIAFNALAALKGIVFVRSPEFDNIKSAILSGKDIKEYVWDIQSPNPILKTLGLFPERLPFGKHSHVVFFLQKDNFLYGIVSLYGVDVSTVVKLGKIEDTFSLDCYVCDWENQKEYTLMDCIKMICYYNDPKLPDEVT